MRNLFIKWTLISGLIVFCYPIISAEGESAVLEEIVVTARKREENIQDTALSVSALSEADVADRFPSDIHNAKQRTWDN